MKSLKNWQHSLLPSAIGNSKRCASLIFQRLNSVLQDLIGKSVFTFLDVVSEDVDSLFRRLGEVFKRFRKAGLNLKFKKCSFLQKEIQYLGHILDHEGVRTTPDKVEAVLKFPTPHDVKSVRSFLGVSGYYRSFLMNCSAIARPLTHLLRKDASFKWGTEQQQAFVTVLRQPFHHFQC